MREVHTFSSKRRLDLADESGSLLLERRVVLQLFLLENGGDEFLGFLFSRNRRDIVKSAMLLEVVNIPLVPPIPRSYLFIIFLDRLKSNPVPWRRIFCEYVNSQLARSHWDLLLNNL